MITIGRIVIYKSRTGDYVVPAIVNCTADTLSPRGVEAGHVPPLTGQGHVHLTVLTPGKPGMRRGASDFVVESEHGRSENQGGTYTEWDIPPATPDGLIQSYDQSYDQMPPATWAWPARL